jgi:hypothetical protein
VQVSGQLEGIEGMLESQLNITDRILDNVDDKLGMLESQLNITDQILDNVDEKLDIDGFQRIEAVFLAFLKSKCISPVHTKFTIFCESDIR